MAGSDTFIIESKAYKKTAIICTTKLAIKAAESIDGLQFYGISNQHSLIKSGVFCNGS